MTSDQQQALRTARAMLDLGHPLELIINSEFIPPTLRDFVRHELQRDQNFPLTPARTLVAEPNRPDWLLGLDRSTWYYWPALRQFLLTHKGWESSALRSLDDSSDRILRQLMAPSTERFDIRGLVLGFVQSGKTANYTAVIAKAVDAGYRLVIVLSGIDNGLRVEIISGLTGEDNVIVHAPGELREGVEVEAQAERAAQPKEGGKRGRWHRMVRRERQ